MAKKKRALIPVAVIKPLIRPIVTPVVQRLDRHEQLLLEVKASLDIQFQRIAAIQAQLDHLAAQRKP